MMFGRKGEEPSEIPDAQSVVQGWTSATEGLAASWKAEVEQHVTLLGPHINRGLEMIRAGHSGKVAEGKVTSRGRRTKWVVWSCAPYVAIDFYGSRDGAHFMECLTQRYESHGYRVGCWDDDSSRVFVTPRNR
jgi:hypothetical protein